MKNESPPSSYPFPAGAKDVASTPGEGAGRIRESLGLQPGGWGAARG